jgi:hypothetical protein
MDPEVAALAGTILTLLLPYLQPIATGVGEKIGEELPENVLNIWQLVKKKSPRTHMQKLC